MTGTRDARLKRVPRVCAAGMTEAGISVSATGVARALLVRRLLGVWSRLSVGPGRWQANPKLPRNTQPAMRVKATGLGHSSPKLTRRWLMGDARFHQPTGGIWGLLCDARKRAHLGAQWFPFAHQRSWATLQRSAPDPRVRCRRRRGTKLVDSITT